MYSFQKDVKRVLETMEYTLKAKKLFYLHSVSSKTFVSLKNGLCPKILTVYKWVPDSIWIGTEQ
jgi:hypothetical protein